MSTTQDAIAVCTSVSRSFGPVHAVREVSCQLMPSDRVAIIGPSGSGKSTLLHLIAGIDVPTSGVVVWPALGARDQLRPSAVGVIFQAPSLLPALTVLENVTLPLLLGGVPDALAVESAHAALAELDLQDLAAKLPQDLSGGQAQRVAVARVLGGMPRLVIADEPTGQLDHETGSHVLDVLETAVQTLHATLVVSTHDHRVADRMPTRWAMRDGRLAAVAA